MSRSRSNEKSKIVSFRISQDEAALLEERASRYGFSRHEYARYVVRDRLDNRAIQSVAANLDLLRDQSEHIEFMIEQALATTLVVVGGREQEEVRAFVKNLLRSHS